MTREEEIKKQADIYTDNASNYAEWSDDGGWSETNDIELVEKAFIAGAKWADKTMIKKACEYFEPILCYETSKENAIRIIENFKKAMEE